MPNGPITASTNQLGRHSPKPHMRRVYHFVKDFCETNTHAILESETMFLLFLMPLMNLKFAYVILMYAPFTVEVYY